MKLSIVLILVFTTIFFTDCKTASVEDEQIELSDVMEDSISIFKGVIFLLPLKKSNLS
jgi:hypothetical protein